MSHQSSPAPSGSSLVAPTAPSGRIKASAKQPMPAGVAANVEEIKYKAKYKELRKKVKEIEHENDQLYYKVLVSRRNVQRMRLERAVLYERLAQLPPSPRHDNPPLPPPVAVLTQPYAPNHPSPVTREPSDRLSARDLEFQELLRANPNGTISVVPGPDGRPIPVMDNGPTRAPLLLHQTGRRTSGDDRHLPPLPSIPSGHMESRHSQHGHNAVQYLHANNLNHPAAPPATRVRPSSSHSQTSRLPSPPYVPQPPATVQPTYSPHIGSPSTRSGSPGTIASGGYTNSHRIHNHQRMGPGTNMNMEEWERQREERIRDRDIDRDRRPQYDTQQPVASRDSHVRASAEEDAHPARSPEGSVDDGSTSRGEGDEPLDRTSPSRTIHAGPVDDGPIGRSPPPESSSAAAAPEMARKQTAEMDVDGADSQPQRHTPVGGQTTADRGPTTPRSHASDEDEASNSRTGGEQDDAMDAD